jgi:DNA-binding protein YbaB
MGPGGFDMQQIFAAAQQAMSAQQELANSEVTGTAGNGAVRAVVSGVGQLLDLTIDPSVVDAADPAETASTIADLVLAAVRDAWDSVIDLQQRQLGALGGGLGGGPGGGFGGPPAGFDLSSLGLPSFGGELGGALDEDEDDEDFDDDEDDADEQLARGEQSAPGEKPAPGADGRLCTKASSSTSSMSSAGCRAWARRAPSASRSTCSQPIPMTSGGSLPRSPR